MRNRCACCSRRLRTVGCVGVWVTPAGRRTLYSLCCACSDRVLRSSAERLAVARAVEDRLTAGLLGEEVAS